MHACSGLARKSTAMRKLPLVSLLCPSENCQSLKINSLDIGRHHRLRRMATGSKMWSSAIDEAIGHRFMGGRHWTLPVCQECLQNLQLTAAEGKAQHGNAFQAMYAQTISLIIFMTQRDMVLGSRTTNRAFQCMMAQETNLYMLISNAMQTNKQVRSSTSIMDNQEAKHACNAT